MIIYPRTYRVPCKVGDLTFWVSPLSSGQKKALSNHIKREGGEEIVDHEAMAMDAIKFGLKDVAGIELPDGSAYKLKAEGEELTEECVQELSQLECLDKLVLTCMKLAAKFGPQDVEGVQMDFDGGTIKKKSRKRA